jgi:hemolysin activation/secretion protein
MKKIILFILLNISLMSYGADPVRNIGEKFLEDEQIQRQIELLEKKQLEVIKPKEEEAIPIEAACFNIKTIQLKGNTLLDRNEIEGVVTPYKNRCLGKDGVNQLMSKLTSIYLEQGFITTRVYIPPQDLKTGVLELVVIEGILENFSINNNSLEDRRKLWWAMPPQRGNYLSIGEIEQGIDQINRVPSANAKMKLWPGEEAGATHIQVLNTVDDEFRGTLEWNNEGQASTGKQKIRFGMDADNILGINDTWGFNYIGSKDTNAVTLNNSFPFRNWTFNISHSYSEYLNILPGNTDLFGQSNTSTIGTNYLFYRTGKQKFSFISNLTVRRSERRLLGIELKPQKLVPFRAALNVSENLPWGFYSFELGLIHGTQLFGASEDPGHASKDIPKAQFNKVDGRFTLVVPKQWISYQTTLAFQYSDDLLYSSEQIHIGDKTTIRGFETTAASGEKGFYWRNDFTLSSHTAITELGLIEHAPWLRYGSLFTFLDVGSVEPRLENRAKRAAGTGLGLRINYKDVAASIVWSKAIEAPEKQSSSEAVYASLQIKVF